MKSQKIVDYYNFLEEEDDNYKGNAEIIDDELHFDYTLKNGICKNMNASFLLKKMEIV